MIETNMYAPLIRQIHAAMEKEANNVLREKDLTVSQIYLLSALKDSPSGSCSLKEMEKLLQIGQSTTVGLVKRLQQKGFVSCARDTEDKRIKIVRITGEGYRICDEAQEYMDKTLERLTMGLTSREKTDLLKLLQKVQQNF